jgi:methylase of polypeptide subunit release factors
VVKRPEALADLLRILKARDYQFVAVTPATHARVLARPAPQALGLGDIFGWNRAFQGKDIDPEILEILRTADALDEGRCELRCKVRAASLGDELFLHSSFPTEEPDAVFFGPDTYRFARFIEEQLPRFPSAGWLVDMGAGSGAGAIAAAKQKRFERITLVDTNAAALVLAAVNAEVAGVAAETLLSDIIPDGADLIIANPPYMIDRARRSYRDGGDLLGGAVALDWAKQAMARLASGGAMLLYTGAAFVGGKAPLLAALARACAESGWQLEVEEIDPDVFGEELEQPGYEGVERIAAVGAVLKAD